MTPTQSASHESAVPLHRTSNPSRVAQVLGHWATFSYWLALVLAGLCLLAASAFSAFTPEPLWARLLTLVLLGLIPALAFYSFGWLVFWNLKAASATYDFTVPVFRRTFEVLGNIVRLTWRLLV
jgi:hypothetical protein